MADRALPAPGRWRGLAAILGLVLIAGTAAEATGPRPQTASTPWACTQVSGQIIVLSVASTIYQIPVAASIYVPPCYDWSPGKLSVIYLLHGGATDQTQWPDLRVRQEADALIAQGVPPFVVVMPGGAYRDGLDYGAFVLDDLIPGVEARLRLRADGSGRAIGGISLGGYWALKLAFQHPDLFAAVGGHSPVIALGGPDDPATLARTAQGLDRLRITLDAGNLDSLSASTEQLAGALRVRGLVVALSINSGGHNRPYWRSHTAEYLRFYMDSFTPLTGQS